MIIPDLAVYIVGSVEHGEREKKWKRMRNKIVYRGRSGSFIYSPDSAALRTSRTGVRYSNIYRVCMVTVSRAGRSMSSGTCSGLAGKTYTASSGFLLAHDAADSRNRGGVAGLFCPHSLA